MAATGVVFKKNGQGCLSYGSKEATLCAGTFGSRILELSAIWSKKLCEAHGIENVNNGSSENLRDHLMVGPFFEVGDGVNTLDMICVPAVIGAVMEPYQQTTEDRYPRVPFACTPLLDFIPSPPREDLKTILDKHLALSDSPRLKAEAIHHASRGNVIESPDETTGAMLCVSAQHHPQRQHSSRKFAMTKTEKYFKSARNYHIPYPAEASRSTPPTPIRPHNNHKLPFPPARRPNPRPPHNTMQSVRANLTARRSPETRRSSPSRR
ncbi:hypothetical protein DOTSEDRAFT_49343 [Dothistroma septosporum NZE10]|uniref:Uncharacterized protein n=1 Tax=Dothistroma septosporum (strain NZE10 / CBS 128990) TaxID=675120 RepID=N1PZN7_DOTSN|nr:hypothetical protein DOTSEDRAFT_49343 [Dothistroma septosporum NZE10]